MTTSIQRNLSAAGDERILSDVVRQLIWQADIDLSNVHAEVRNGNVLLSGSVPTCIERIEAENAAKAPFGVHSVVNNLDVVADSMRPSLEIASDILGALRNSTHVVEQLPEVVVHDGLAILSGRCRWAFQRDGAERAALSIPGVRSVSNLIVIDASAPTEERKTPPGLVLLSKAG